MGHMFSMYAIPITYEMAFKIAQILYPNKENLTVSVSEEK